MLRIEPELPMLKMLPTLPMLNTEPALPMLSREPALSMLPTLKKLRKLCGLFAFSRPTMTLRTLRCRAALKSTFLRNIPPSNAAWNQSIIALQDRSERTASFTAGTTSLAKVST
jgi:hypothetical protein